MRNKYPRSPPKLSLKTRIFITAVTTVTDLARRRDGTVNRRLLSFLDRITPPNPNPVDGVSSVDVAVDPARELWFRLFLPSAAAAAGEKIPVIVFFHGGGFAFMSPASRVYDDYCRRISREISAAVVSVNYRLAPENKHPAQYVDGLDVLRFLDGDEGSIGALADLDLDLDLSNCFLMGDSAGGNIAHHLAKYYAAENNKWKKIILRGVILLQPYFGGEERTESELTLKGAPLVSVDRTDWLWRAFLPEGANRDHEAVNVFMEGREGEGGELGEGFPMAAMVVIGGWDPLQDWQRRYAEGLRRRGREVRVVEYGEAIHTFYSFPEMEESGMLIEEVRDFMATYKVVGECSLNSVRR